MLIPGAVEALALLDAGRLGDGPERHAVRALADELDRIAWDAQDQVESGATSEVEYRHAFARARAAAALDHALAIDPVSSAFEAIYEVCYAIEDVNVVIGAVRSCALD